MNMHFIYHDMLNVCKIRLLRFISGLLLFIISLFKHIALLLFPHSLFFLIFRHLKQFIFHLTKEIKSLIRDENNH